MKTWDEFKKYKRASPNALDFYGCVYKNGLWFDSSDSFEIAVHWCCYSAGQYGLSVEEEIKWIATEGHERGYSILHGEILKQMYEKGLIH